MLLLGILTGLLWLFIRGVILSSKVDSALVWWFVGIGVTAILSGGGGTATKSTILVSSIILDLEPWCARGGVPDAGRLSKLIPDFLLLWGKRAVNL